MQRTGCCNTRVGSSQEVEQTGCRMFDFLGMNLVVCETE